jgi:hypothetical protein
MDATWIPATHNYDQTIKQPEAAENTLFQDIDHWPDPSYVITYT